MESPSQTMLSVSISITTPPLICEINEGFHLGVNPLALDNAAKQLKRVFTKIMSPLFIILIAGPEDVLTSNPESVVILIFPA